MNSSTGQQPFLKHPPALIKLSTIYLLIEIGRLDTGVGSLAGVIVVINVEVFAIDVLPEKSLLRIGSRCCSDCAICSSVDVFHTPGFFRPVLFTVLDNAKRVNPKVVYAETLRYLDSVPKGQW